MVVIQLSKKNITYEGNTYMYWRVIVKIFDRYSSIIIHWQEWRHKRKEALNRGREGNREQEKTGEDQSKITERERNKSQKKSWCHWPSPLIYQSESFSNLFNCLWSKEKIIFSKKRKVVICCVQRHRERCFFSTGLFIPRPLGRPKIVGFLHWNLWWEENWNQQKSEH